MDNAIGKEEQVIKRVMADYPRLTEIVDFSTPVVSFGNPNDAEVATLGINPSSNEFQVGKGNKSPLGHLEKKRLVDTESLGVSQPKSLTREQAIRVIRGCYDYFLGPNANPYDWFNNLENLVLKPFGYSYNDKNALACHLDLVQWATDPVWSKIKSPAVKNMLLSDDKEFLKYQLTSYAFKFVFLNGGTVIDQFSKLDIVNLEVIGEVTRNSKGGKHLVYRGKIGDTTYLGWGINVGARDANKQGLAELSQLLGRMKNCVK